MKKNLVVVMLLVASMVAVNTFGYTTTSWTNMMQNGEWSSPLNWSNGVPNGAGWWANIGDVTSVGPTIHAGNNASAEVINMTGQGVTMNVTGGYIYGATFLMADATAAETATLNISGGTVDSIITELGNGISTINMTGGVWNSSAYATLVAAGNRVNLGGTGQITGGYIWLGTNTICNITGEGKIISSTGGASMEYNYTRFATDVTPQPGWGTILGNGLLNNCLIDYDGRVAGCTVVTAIPEPVTMALLGLGGLMLIRRRKQ